jgi:signal transduction histidine kinase
MPDDQKASILLVDDRPENLLTLEAVLDDLGQNLVRAGSGKEALRYLLEKEFAVILLDVQMPEMDGFQTAELIRSRPRSRHIPIIFLTALNKSESHVFHGYSIGAVDYVFKPFVPEVLRSKVATFVELAKKQEELRAEVDHRKQAEEEVRRLNQDLERRVSERTAELTATNRKLEAEIAERRQLEVALQQRAEELAAAGRRKDEFLAMLAHELRNPLAPIQNAAQVQRLCGANPEVLQRQREIIERQVRHLARLVDDLLDVSRITRGIIELRKEPVDLRWAVEQASEAARPLIEEYQHELRVSLPQEPLPLEADPARLQQILVNLLHNAAKYMKPGGTIWLAGEREGDSELASARGGATPGVLLLRVRDTGVGIAPDLLPHVFDLFTQADRSLDRSQGGLGIGLTMVQRLTQLHGGTVAAFSPGMGQGSEFVVRLPAATDLEQVITSSPHQVITASAVAAPNATRVLVVDDNVDAAETLAELLQVWGCDVHVVHDGPAAIQTAIATVPTFILLDIGLPGMDGYEVAGRLREQECLRNTVLVAVTGYGQDDDLRLAREAKLDYHLTKPVAPEVLRELILETSAGRPLLC